MTNLHRPEWPERRELVLATVKNVENYGAYVTLEEYGDKRGFLHRNEISTSWVRNIRNHVREGQKLVLKVLRVDPNKGHIDLSKKRVSKRERIEKKLLSYVYPQLRQQPYFGKNIKKLKNYRPETWRYRIGSHRFFYTIDDRKKIVFMISADNRQDAY